MRVLITAGPTREPIDAVRYIGNRSSGKMGAMLAGAALAAGHDLTLVLGPVGVAMPEAAVRIDVETAAQMHEAVLAEFPKHDLLIMAAAVADYRPTFVRADKMARRDLLVIECEATPDIVAFAGQHKRADQRVVGFSLEAQGTLERAREKLAAKRLDLIVYNPIQTMESDDIRPTLLWPDGKREDIALGTKRVFAQTLVDRAMALFQ